MAILLQGSDTLLETRDHWKLGGNQIVETASEILCASRTKVDIALPQHDGGNIVYFRRYRILSILGWFAALFALNLALSWHEKPDSPTLSLALAALDRLMTLPELVLSAAVVYGICSRRPLVSTGRLATYTSVGLVGIVLTFALSQQGQFTNISPWIRGVYSGVTLARSRSLSPVELFQKTSPSVFVVQALDENGKALALGSAVALAHDFLVTNCHVVSSGSSLKVSRGKENWAARLIQAAPNHDLCGLRPAGLTAQPVEVRLSSKLATGEHVYAIGSPVGLELTFSEGVISALRESEAVRMIQTSAPISPGSSGGGLFDSRGNLVGITTFYLKEGQSLNFALPGEWANGVLVSSTPSSGPANDTGLESRAWMEIGLEAVEKEEYDVAGHALRKCADLKQSDAPRAWLELGNLAERASNFDSTSDAYKAWFREHQWSPDEGLTNAVTSFENAIEQKPDYAEAWRELARAHSGRREYDQAISAAIEATRLSPGDWNGWLVLGLIYSRKGSYALAIDAFERGVRVAPDDKKYKALYCLGMGYAEKGDREKVLTIYQQLKDIAPKAAENFFKVYVLPTR